MRYRNVYLKDIAEIVMGQSPKSTFYNNEGDGMPFLQGVRTFGENYPQIDTYTTAFNRVASSGEILFSVRAPVGRVNWANQKIAIGRGLASIKVKNGYSKEYLYYFFKRIGDHLDSIATGTVFTSINKKELEELKIKIPVELCDQKRIARYLRKIDLKIEKNNQINDNLAA
ncbi:restriction endonuclease subunit S [uncultured Limosilactobacillus sp.]|uniref:restriction endonuclease subunit S n=1 Tax=uncultured Limosilactobacillus sp. TaxID=2837629 RepID=UPI0025D06EAE|nr:restriction endonuclease subunit S [uncultured Limosilactobacillus sp.]